MKKKKIKLSFFEKNWNPQDYLSEFYINTVVADELEAVKYQVEFFKELKFSPLILEFGCGPTLHRAIAAAKYVSEIHMSDYLESNLEEVRRWVEKKPGRQRTQLEVQDNIRNFLRLKKLDEATQALKTKAKIESFHEALSGVQQ